MKEFNENVSITISCTSEEKKSISIVAAEKGKTISGFVLDAVKDDLAQRIHSWLESYEKTTGTKPEVIHLSENEAKLLKDFIKNNTIFDIPVIIPKK